MKSMKGRGLKKLSSKKTNLIKKVVLIIVCFIISIASSIVQVVTAAEIDGTTIFCEHCIAPASNQYLELKATDVVEVEGNGKQLIMELWGHNIKFKRI